MATNWKQLDMNLCSKDSAVVLTALEELKASKKEFGQEATNAIIPKCIDKLLHHDILTRSSAMAVIATQIQLSNTSMLPHLEVLCKKLHTPNMLDLKAGQDEEEHYISLHNNMCFIFSTLQNSLPRKLMTSFKPICHYLIDCTAHETKDVASGGVQFWAKMNIPPVPSNMMDVWVPAVLIQLNKLIPAILGCMVYQEEHVNYLEKPGNRSSMGENIEKLADLRNYAALAFEKLCRIFQTEIKAIFKPILEKRAMSDNWLEMEASLLALSAFTEAMGTPQEMKDLYPVLIPRLLELYSHPKPLVRSITCFTMQRFVGVKMKQVKDPFPKVIKSTTALLSDPYPEVRVMALRSMAVILAYTEHDCAPYSDKITEGLANFTPPDKDAKSTLFETIGHYFGRMGTLVEQADTRRLISPLMDQWRALTPEGSDKDETAMLCQSLCTIATYTKANFAPYTEPLFEKSANYLEKVVTKVSKSSKSDSTVNHLVAYMDLLSAVVEGQGNNVQSIAEKYGVIPKVLELLKEKKTQPPVVQSALALVGNLSNHCYESVELYVNDFIQIIQAKLASKHSSVEIKNNAVWCLSFFSEKGEQPNDNLIMMTDTLIQMLKDPQTDKGIIINAALTLTNLGMIWPKQMNNALTNDEVFMSICILLQTAFPRDLERDRLFKNMVCIAQENMKKIKVASWAQYCTAAAIVTSYDASLNTMLKSNLKDVRSSLGQNGWKKLSLQIGPQLGYALRKKYKLY